VNRSLLFAFFMAVIFHGLLAWVQLDLFTSPMHVQRPFKTLIISVVTPMPIKKPPLVESAQAIKKPAPKRPVEKNIPSRSKDKPKEAAGNRREPEKQRIPKKKIQQKEETLSRPSPVPQPTPEQETLPHVDTSLAAAPPDLAMEPLRTENTSEKAAEGKSLAPTPELPVTFAVPDYKRNRLPVYPLLARRRGYQGTVLLEVLVTKDGTVGSVRLVRSSGAEILDKAAKKGVKKWLFHPAKKGDEAVEMWVKVPIKFQLTGH
jgi:protein TonB